MTFFYMNIIKSALAPHILVMLTEQRKSRTKKIVERAALARLGGKQRRTSKPKQSHQNGSVIYSTVVILKLCSWVKFYLALKFLPNWIMVE